MNRALISVWLPVALMLVTPVWVNAAPASPLLRLAQNDARPNNAQPLTPQPIAVEVPFDATHMRKALQLPTSQAQFGFNSTYSPVMGTTWRWQFDPAPEPKTEVARLTATLKNTTEDADTWLHIGYFRKEASDTPGAVEAYGKAEALFRAQGVQRPQDVAPLIGLDAALDGLNRPEEGEKILRDAIKLAPNDPRPLTALAGVITGRISAPLFSELAHATQLSASTTLNAPESAQRRADQNALDESLGRLLAMATPAQLQIAEARLEEVKTLNDLAVALAPRQSSVYLERAGNASSRFSITQTLQALSTAKQQLKAHTTPEARQAAIAALLSNTYSTFITGIMNADAQTDLERAARFSVPEEAARLHSMAAFIGTIRGKFSQDLPPEQQAAIRATIDANVSEVEKLAQTAQPPSARLWSLLGLVYMVQTLSQGDDDEDNPQTKALVKSAEDAARRALALDEHQNIAWDVLMISVAKNDERLAEMQQLAERRLALDPSSSNQFILARNLALQDKDQDALQQTEVGLKNSPDDWSLRLLRATLLLRQPDEASLQAAVPLMAALERSPQSSGSEADLYSALTGVMLARQHHFYEAELVLAASGTADDTQKLSPLYIGFMADLQGFAVDLAKVKRHEDVLAITKIFAGWIVKPSNDFYLKQLGLSEAEVQALTK